MNKASKVVGAAFGGTAGGVALVFILCVATGVIAVSTGSSASLPWVFAVTPGTENGALSLEFQPNFAGIVVLIALTALTNVLWVLRRGGTASSSSGQEG